MILTLWDDFQDLEGLGRSFMLQGVALGMQAELAHLTYVSKRVVTFAEVGQKVTVL